MCPHEHLEAERVQYTMEEGQRVAQNRLADIRADLQQNTNQYGTTRIEGYGAFTQYLQVLPRTAFASRNRAHNENLGYKERKKKEKEMERQYKEFGKANRLLHLGEVFSLSKLQTAAGQRKWLRETLPHSQLTREETLQQILRDGDYSNFENLDGVLRNVVAGSELTKFLREYHVTENSDPETLCRQIQENTEGVSGLLNPGLRLALSLAQNSREFPENMRTLFRRLDEAMSTAVMVATLTHQPDQERVENYFRGRHSDPEAKARESIRANRAQQIQIAKRLLLMQLSRFRQVNADGHSQNWEKSMAVAISHCSRVVLTLPRKEEAADADEIHARMWRSILTINGENPAQDNRRGGSTHSVKRRKVGDPDGVSKEKKVIVNLIGQRGMNCAIGGLGNAGISQKTLCNDGSCGHFYSMYKEADTTHYGTMLMGLESDANGVTNQMGHTHDMHATPEKASSLGGQRVDEIGKKYGGRQCDLTEFTAEDVTAWMNALEAYMVATQRNVVHGDEAEKAAYQRMMSLLAGGPMTQAEWAEFRGRLVMPEEVRGRM